MAKKKKLKKRGGSRAKKASGTSGGSSKSQEIIDFLDENGCISKELLPENVLSAIGKLSVGDAKALARVNEKVPLNLFFKSRGPQEG